MQLSVDRVEVVGLVLPELELNSWPWIFAILESLFWFELEDALDLLGPGHDGAFKDVGFILFRTL